MSVVGDTLKTKTDDFASAIQNAEAAVNPRDLENLRRAIARRLASAGAARFLADPAVKRIGEVGKAGRRGTSDVSAGTFGAEVDKFLP